MNYKIDNVSLSEFGVYPTNASGEKIALSGLFDLPKRKGTTEYDWGTSIEPFVDASDIELDGRSLTLNVAIKGSSLADLHSKLVAFKEACIACKKLWTEVGEFDVIQKDEIAVTEYPFNCVAVIKAPFWEYSYVPANITIPASGNGEYMLDSYNLAKDFGLHITSFRDVNSTAKRVEGNTTLLYKETSHRSYYDFSQQCNMVGNDIYDLYNKMHQLNSLLITPGLHTLKLPGNTARSVYFKDGTTVTYLSSRVLRFDLKCRVING